MSVIEEISRMSKVGCSNKELLDYIYKNYDEIECELNGNESKEPKKCNYDLCINCNLEMTIDYQKSTLVCTNCGLCEYYPVYVASYNHMIQPLRRKCLYKRSDNFKVILNQFFFFGGHLFRQVIGIPMGTNCAPLLADLFLYSYENEFLDNMIKSGHRRLARSFNLCYRYIDDLIVFNNKKFLDYLKEIYPSELTVEKANKSDHLADYLDLTVIIDSGGKLSTRLYDKRDDFDFHIVHFPFLSSNIPYHHGMYILQLIRYA